MRYFKENLLVLSIKYKAFVGYCLFIISDKNTVEHGTILFNTLLIYISLLLMWDFFFIADFFFYNQIIPIQIINK